MLVLDLFSGTGSSTQAFEDRGHVVVRVELNPRQQADIHDDILSDRISADRLRGWLGGTPDFVWASPPCTAFSVASIGTHWTGGHRAYVPATEAAMLGQALVAKTLRLIAELNPRAWLVENPRGVLRKLPVVADLPRRTVTYCQYGDERMKPTDLWGVVPGWTPRPMCRNGAACHDAAPRGSRTGTQGRTGAADRSRVPYALSLEVCLAVEASWCVDERAAVMPPAPAQWELGLAE